MLGRHVQGAALAVLAKREVEVWPVVAGGIPMAGAGRGATAAGGFREATLDHGAGGLYQLARESVFPTHLKIVRYNDAGGLSRDIKHI